MIILNDVIPDTEGMQEHNQNTADTVFQAALEGKSDGYCGRTYDCGNGRGVNAQLYGNLENEERIQPHLQRGIQKLLCFLAGIGTLQRITCQLSDKTDDSGANQKCDDAENHADEQIQKGLGRSL